MFEVLKGVPLPPKRDRKVLNTYLEKLNIGECVCINIAKNEIELIRSNVKNVSLRLSKGFSVRMLPDGRCGIWRIS